jgi:peptidoglycan/xylan/chitin deacetylase (PgdA/CDA1 family)
MKGFLNNNHIEYLFFHLNYTFDLHHEIKNRIVFVYDLSEIENYTDRIIFNLSSHDINLKRVKLIDNIPVLFPSSDRNDIFYFKNNNLIFSDDILKSAFYLLSGYQEYGSGEKDNLGRYPYKASVQCKLGIIAKPVVNYYFDYIKKGVRSYCEKANIKFSEKKLFERFGFILTHDIDRIDKYDWYYNGYKIKELLGLVKTSLPKSKVFRLLIQGLSGNLGLLSNNNPYWNFTFLQEAENKYGFKASYFFLPKDIKHTDAYYDLEEERLVRLYKELTENGHEIGLHGTVGSSESPEKMKRDYNRVTHIMPQKVFGIRQHRLNYVHPWTSVYQGEIGIAYDNSLGFAAHEGFRNSYCLPFKLYDFKKDKIVDIWEFPLNVMDITLFAYQGYKYDDAIKSIQNLIIEIKKMHGIFTLLWHNSFFDEIIYPGITNFYLRLLGIIKNEKPVNILFKDLLKNLP